MRHLFVPMATSSLTLRPTLAPWEIRHSTFPPGSTNVSVCVGFVCLLPLFHSVSRTVEEKMDGVS